MWAYCTLGMSLDREDNNLIEAVIYSPREDEALVELLSLVSSFHNNSAALNLHHTFEIGHSWLDDSLCNYGFVSLPYLDGEGLEIFKFEDKVFHCYWIIPITKSERELKIKHGCEALENLFEEKGINYVNPNRLSLV